VSLTWRDLRDRLAQVLVQASSRSLDTLEKACEFVERELDFSLSHTYGGHSSCVNFSRRGSIPMSISSATWAAARALSAPTCSRGSRAGQRR
jgi:hypothetical protein